MRERGSGMKTIHEKKALKHIDKFFGKKNLDEKLLDAKNQAQQCVNRVANDLASKFDWEWNRLDEVAKQFIVQEHWESFVDYVGSNPQVDIHTMPERFERKLAGKQVRDALGKDEHYLVYVDGQNYAIFRKNEPTQIKVSEELPEFIRRSVGMLKLVEDNQIVSGIGCRVNATTYVVLQQI
jgi:Rps23 Pro-64 3,4-dihydroxylase Tpa1-like proline 4-hydroxylase